MQSLKEVFPKLQVIATTHSPLIVLNMRLDQVVVLRRNSGGSVYAFRPAEELKELGLSTDLSALRSDQVLTSPLFGLASARSPIAAERIARYAELRSKLTLTPDEQEERDKLRRYIIDELRTGETKADRDVEIKGQSESREAPGRFAERVGNMSPDDKKALRGLLGDLVRPVDPAAQPVSPLQTEDQSL